MCVCDNSGLPSVLDSPDAMIKKHGPAISKCTKSHGVQRFFWRGDFELLLRIHWYLFHC